MIEIIMRTCCFLVLIALGLSAAHAQAAGVAKIDVPADQSGPALHGVVWTPCAAAAGDIEVEGSVVSGVRNCPLAEGQYPLVVISHGQGATVFTHHDTAEKLADAGFVVAAINHPDDYNRTQGAGDVVAFATRTTDIRRLIDYMTQLWALRINLAPGQIGFFGVSRGGYTGLVLAGADPDFQKFAKPAVSSPCATAPNGPACVVRRQKFRELLTLPLTNDNRIKAAVIVDPLSSVFDDNSLKRVTIPIQLWASEYGGNGVSLAAVAAIRQNLPNPPEWHVARHASHIDFIAPCAPAWFRAFPELCNDAPPFDRIAFHVEFNAKVTAFLHENVAR